MRSRLRAPSRMLAASTAMNSSACTAWARSFTRRSVRNFQRPRCGSMRRSVATATCSPIWCGGSWRMARIHPSSRSRPIPRCRSRRCSGARRAGSETRCTRGIRTSRCRAICMGRNGGILSGVEFGDRASLEALLVDVRAADTPPAADQGGGRGGCARRHGGGGGRLSRPGRRLRLRSGLPSLSAPAICSKRGAGA